MLKITLKFNGYKAWELLTVLKEFGTCEGDLIKGNGWRARIIKEYEEFRFNFSLPITEVEIEGDDNHVNNLIKELKIRLLKGGG